MELYVVCYCGWWCWVVKVVVLEGLLKCGVVSYDAGLCRKHMVLLRQDIVWLCETVRIDALLL